MDFASSHVYDPIYEGEDIYEAISDEEFHGGMDLSDDSCDSDSESEADSKSAAGKTTPPAEAPKPTKPSVFGRMKGMLDSLSKSATGSDAASPPPPPPPCLPPRQQKSKPGKSHHWKSGGKMPLGAGVSSHQKKRVFRRADTNVILVRFDTLKTPSTMHAGEVITCTGCEAVMSYISNLEDDGPDKIWQCEFCGTRNLVEIEDEEKPTADDVTYLVEPALSTATIGNSGRDESIVIFCIDISGSMTVTTEVVGQHKMRGSASLRRLRRENTMEGDQHLPSERRNITYISRLLAVQAAVGHQLEEMAKEFPHRRVGLVAFSSEVVVIGDGTTEEVTISGRKLLDRDELIKIGDELPCPKAVKDTRLPLEDKLYKLEEGGATALGPAILVALSMASQHPGSKVILCTDGKSNEGVGKVENLVDTDPDPDDFYESVAVTANSKGVSISVITISGTDCKLIQLGKLADSTQGQVNIVDPLKLTEEFSSVLANKIIATSVVATCILHKGLYIGREENDQYKEKRQIGSVSAEHEISFEFGVRKRKTKEAAKSDILSRISEVPATMEENPPSTLPSGVHTPQQGDTNESEMKAKGEAATAAAADSGDVKCDADIPPELPFQLQINYTDADGTKALRVLTQKKPVTKDRTVAEKDVDLVVLGVHTEKLSSELALQGDYTGSRGVALMNQRLGWRSSHGSEDAERRKVYRKAFSRVRTVENTVSERQMAELEYYGRTHSDEEYDDCAATPALTLQSKRLKKKKIRSAEVDDGMAQQLYQARSKSTTYCPGGAKSSKGSTGKK